MEPKQQPPYPLRISPELRNKLEKEAFITRRSLNAEIADRLERSFEEASSPNLGGAALMHSLARAEEEAAASQLESAARLLRGATVAQVLMRVLLDIEEKSLDAEFVGLDLDAAYAEAYKLATEAEHLIESGGFGDAMDATERAEKRRAAAREAVTKRLEAPEIVSERIVKTSGPRKDGSRKVTKEIVTEHNVVHRDERNPTGRPRTIPVAVRKKRTFIQRDEPPES